MERLSALSQSERLASETPEQRQTRLFNKRQTRTQRSTFSAFIVRSAICSVKDAKIKALSDDQTSLSIL